MAILLATTISEGREFLESSSLPTLVSRIITPRNVVSARGVTTDHVFATPAFLNLPHEKQARVLRVVLPCIATSPCDRCHDMWADRWPTNPTHTEQEQ